LGTFFIFGFDSEAQNTNREERLKASRPQFNNTVFGQQSARRIIPMGAFYIDALKEASTLCSGPLARAYIKI